MATLPPFEKHLLDVKTIPKLRTPHRPRPNLSAVSSYGIDAGTIALVKTQKVTVHVDRDLLRRAQKRTGKGVTATVRHGLELVAASGAYEQLRALRGNVKFSLDLATLRADRP